ncbi:MAG TPA: HEAT repeat domain-containing protein [Verrucomicrobiota bacterium]|nr:HEAT repeat domain-containing protein [Verrucomicrobiota bacterium]
MIAKRRIITISVVMVAVSLFAYSILFEKPEPRYAGKNLSEWLALYQWPERNGGVITEAEVAVREIGTNALPFLCEWLRYELPPWRRGLLRLATRPVEGKTLDEGKVVYGQSLILGKSSRLSDLAELGFIILNTNAAAAIPELETLMKDKNSDVAVRAIYALGAIGGAAIPVLTNALADVKQANRCRIMEAIYGVEIDSHYYRNQASTGSSLPALTQSLNDSDKEVRRQAKITLYNLARHGIAPLAFAETTEK